MKKVFLRRISLIRHKLLNLRKMGMWLMNHVFIQEKNKVVFTSFNDQSYSDNPRAISEKLHELLPDAKIVWIFKDNAIEREIVPDYIQCVSSGKQSIYELATARVWVDNFNKSPDIYKGKNQYYIQTWHGDRGFKKILYDAWPDRKRPFKVVEENICDLAVAGSDYGVNQFRSAFNYAGEIMKVGCPRNDLLVQNDRTLVQRLKEKLHVNADEKIWLYAPTFREKQTEQYKKLDINSTLAVLEEKTHHKWVCFFRAHKREKAVKHINETEKIRDVTSYEDMSELLLISDLLITDYSSSAGDFALLNKPIILFHPDYQSYIDGERGMYFDPIDSPFLIVKNQSELEKIIRNFNKEAIYQNCTDILEFYGTEESGRASIAVAEYIISKIRGE